MQTNASSDQSDQIFTICVLLLRPMPFHDFTLFVDHSLFTAVLCLRWEPTVKRERTTNNVNHEMA